MSYPIGIPDTINAGDTVEFTLQGFDSQGTEVTYTGGYTLYLIMSNESNLYSATTTADTSAGYLMQIPSTATTGWTAASYNATAYVDDGTNRYQITTKPVGVSANLFNGAAVDLRSMTRKIFDALEAAILGAATDNQLSMSIAGRSIQRMGMEELIVAKQKYEYLVWKEDQAQRAIDGKPIHNRVKIRFG